MCIALIPLGALGIQFRAGRLYRRLESGIHFFIPFVDTVHTVKDVNRHIPHWRELNDDELIVALKPVEVAGKHGGKGIKFTVDET